MKTYARIAGGLVAELLMTDGDITAMFNSAIVWIDVTSGPAIAEGWSFDGAKFSPPPPPPPVPPAPTIAELQSQIAELAAELAVLSNAAKP